MLALSPVTRRACQVDTCDLLEETVAFDGRAQQLPSSMLQRIQRLSDLEKPSNNSEPMLTDRAPHRELS